MSRAPITSLREDMNTKAAGRRAETYDVVNLRPGAKVAAMMELLAELRGVPVSTMLTDALSDRLSKHAASDPAHAAAILNAAEGFVSEHGVPSEDSALGKLAASGLLTVETALKFQHEMEKQFASLFTAKGDEKSQKPDRN